jgi:predicted membrane channel-forming protein YqfA (hemolysin III family)
MTNTEVIRLGGLLLVTIAILFYLYQYRRNNNKRLMYLAVLSWLAHAFVFYFVLVFFHSWLDPLTINTWSQVLRYSIIILLIVIGAF